MYQFFRRFRIVHLMLVVLMITTAAGVLLAQPVAKAAGPNVQVWLTTTNGANKLARQTDLQFNTDSGSATTIDVNAATRMQKMVGFGASITDSSAWLLYTKLSTAQRNAVMTNLFSRDPANPTSIGLSFSRLPMGASDFAVNGHYSYNDMPPGQRDPSLSNFSIDHDKAYILPIVQQAYQLNPSLTFMASPWSPPGWMKSNDSMIGRTNGIPSTLNSQDYEAYAQYFVKFIQAYGAAPYNIPIHMISPVNEPLWTPTDYPGMSWDVAGQSRFIKNNLAPALRNANLQPKILGYDHDWNNYYFAQGLLSDPDTNRELAGIAWHCYNGDPSAMTMVRNQYPDKEVHVTECSTDISITRLTTIQLLMRSVQNWSQTVHIWNIALNPNHGPHTGGCQDCKAPITVDENTGTVTYTNDYYMLGHFSKFVAPGAYHIASTGGNNNLMHTAFENPDGSKVVVVNNQGGGTENFKIRAAGQSFNYSLPGGGTVSFVWSDTTTQPTPTPTPTVGQTPTSTPTPTPTPTSTPTTVPVPTVSLTSPANGATFNAPATIQLSASASIGAGSISRVEFYHGTTLIGTANSAPYTYTWSNVAAGSYTLTARAYGTPGTSATSSPVQITVSTTSSSNCYVIYQVLNQWPGGFTANVSILNNGTSAIQGWSLKFAFPNANQRVSNLWNGAVTQSGQEVTVTNLSYNATIPAGQSTSFGFNGSYTGSNPIPTAFTVNNQTCLAVVP